MWEVVKTYQWVDDAFASLLRLSLIDVVTRARCVVIIIAGGTHDKRHYFEAVEAG